jgi:hypothetical protein
MIIPPFDDLPGTNNGTGRKLGVKMSDIDVTRDILALEFSLNNPDASKAAVQYTLDIVSWTDEGMEIFVNFTDPLSVSQGANRDTVKL